MIVTNDFESDNIEAMLHLCENGAIFETQNKRKKKKKKKVIVCWEDSDKWYP